MKDYSETIEPGIMLGKENGLTLMLDAEVYDYAFSPQRGEGFKVREGPCKISIGCSKLPINQRVMNLMKKLVNCWNRNTVETK